MKPSRHVIVSVGIGAVLSFLFKNLYTGLVCLLAGVIIDIDHILEYMIQYGWKDFTFKKCYLICNNRQFKRIHLFLHSVEIFLLLWFFVVYTRNIYLLAGTLGYSFHMLLDVIGNKIYVRSYCLIWRTVNKFSSSRFYGKR